MGLKDLFKSARERDKDKERKRRHAFRAAERVVDDVKDRVNKFKKESEVVWAEAREYRKAGQKAASLRALQSYRANQIMGQKLEMKRWVYEQLVTKLELAKSDEAFTNALGLIDTVVAIDPEKVDDVLSTVEDKLGEQVDVDRIWEKMYGKEMEGVKGAMEDVVPSMDELEKQLEDEAAEEIGDKTTAIKESTGTGKSVAEKIGEGRARLKKLLEEE